MTLSDLLEKTKGFTPGPWRRGQAGNLRIYGPDGMGEWAGSLAQALPKNGCQSANAELIAAAPYLLTLAQEQAAKLEAIAAELDWHAFYTEVETKRYGLAEKVEEQAAEIERLKGALEKLQKAIEQEPL